jgi:UDP-glucose 4-epimerase
MNEVGKRVLVTGGAGFIGSHLCDTLVSGGLEVVAIDNLSNGKIENLSLCNEKKNFRFIKTDLRQNISDIIKNSDTLYHMAAYPEVRTGFDSPELAYEQNVQNTYNLLESVRQSKISEIVFASSSVVYGEPKTIPTPETYGPLIPISQYGGSKLACEGLISSYCHTYGIRGVIIRLANVIGFRSNHGVIWDFINKLKKNQSELEILGDGNQTKSYIHISDTINGFLFCSKISKDRVDVFNIGNDDKIDVRSIANIVCKNLNLKNIQIIQKGGTNDGRGWIGDVKQMQLDITKIKSLGWNARYSSLAAVDLAVKEMLRG